MIDDARAKLLDEPLDRTRVRTRKGPGGKTLSYIAASDAIRAANRIFGFGGWGYSILVQERLGEVTVTSGEREGVHVAYRCVIRLTVPGCEPVDGSGYGDAVEYGSAARLTASELALKESEADAMKRALHTFGDQFGLSLYGDDARARRGQDEPTERKQADPTWPEMLARFGALVGGRADAEAWLEELAVAITGERSLKDASSEARGRVYKAFLATVEALEEVGEELVFSTGVRGRIAAAFKTHAGVSLAGPEWSLGPDEADRPAREPKEG